MYSEKILFLRFDIGTVTIEYNTNVLYCTLEDIFTSKEKKKHKKIEKAV